MKRKKKGLTSTTSPLMSSPDSTPQDSRDPAKTELQEPMLQSTLMRAVDEMLVACNPCLDEEVSRFFE